MSSAPLSGLVMAGGRGTRMAAHRPDVPKALVEVSGRSLLARAIGHLASARPDRIHVAIGPDNAGALAQQVHALDGSHGWPPLTVLPEPSPLGTIGALALITEPGHVLVCNGDLLSAIDLPALLTRHASAGADLTLAVHTARHRLALGEVILDDDGGVRSYREKPEKHWNIASGTSVIGPAVRALLVQGEALDVPELVERALNAGLIVTAHRHRDPWLDVNDAHDLAAAERLLADNPDLDRAPCR